MSRKKWSSEKIFTRLINNKTQNTYWDNISELRKRPNQEVYKKAYELAKSDNANQKVIGLDILQQLGFDPRFNKKQTVELYFELLKDIQSNKVLKSIFYGIGHNNDELNEKQISKLVEFKTIKNNESKFALISALSGLENTEAIKTLIEFTEDKIPKIRDWATFAIGTLIESNNSEIRNALWKRTNDTDFETKSEAIVGLANRKDEKVKNVIKSELENVNYDTLLFEAIITLNDKEFLPLLNQNLEIAKKEKDDVTNGWVLALEGTIAELENNDNTILSSK